MTVAARRSLYGDSSQRSQPCRSQFDFPIQRSPRFTPVGKPDGPSFLLTCGPPVRRNTPPRGALPWRASDLVDRTVFRRRAGWSALDRVASVEHAVLARMAPCPELTSCTPRPDSSCSPRALGGIPSTKQNTHALVIPLNARRGRLPGRPSADEVNPLISCLTPNAASPLSRRRGASSSRIDINRFWVCPARRILWRPSLPSLDPHDAHARLSPQRSAPSYR